jgi:hypothetical protein
MEEQQRELERQRQELEELKRQQRQEY